MGEEKLPILGDKAIYADWKAEVSIWELGTSVEPEKRAAKLIMNMKGTPRSIAIHLDKKKLVEKEGVTYLLAELDKLFNKDDHQSCLQI